MKLTVRFKFAYGFSEIFTNLMLFMVLSYELVFLTAVCGINTYLVGIIMTTGSILDAASVFYLGPLIERSRMKWGRYRSWLLICFPLSLFFVLLFSNYVPLLKSNVLVVIVYTILHAIYAILNNITYITRYNFNASLTTDPKERMGLASLRQGGAAIGSFAGGYLYLAMIYYFGNSAHMTSKGFFWTAFTLGIGLIFGYLILFKYSKQYANTGININEDGTPETVPTAELYKFALKEKDLVLMILAEFFRFLSKCMVLTLAPLFFMYVSGDIAKWSIYYSFTAAAVMAGALVAGPLSKVMTKKKIYIVCVLASAAMFAGMFIFSGNANLAIACAVIGNLLLAPTDVLYTVMFADINDNIIWKHHKSARSVVYALMSLACEAAYLVGYSIATFGLALIGYQASLPITPEIITGIKYIAVAFPAIALVIAALCACGYSVDEKRMAEIRDELSKNLSK